MSMSRIAARVFGSPLLMDEGKAIAFLAGLGGRLVDGGVVLPQGLPAVEHVAFENGRPSMGKVGDPTGRYYASRGRNPIDVLGNVAIIPVEGTLVHKGGYVGSASGETSYEGLQTQIMAARNSGLVKGVVFEVDSFGGEAAGAFETADLIAQLSAEKPTIAILTDFALSAGYLMASAARQIVMPAFGRVGSIGVLRIHADISQKLAKDGVKVTLITAGKHKADGNGVEPLPEDVFNTMKADAEAMRVVFAEHVGRYRGGRFDQAAALATEAADYGAQEALSLGLVDGVGKAQEAFSAFVNAINTQG
jgi:ClpP class serine protease